jgi:hypothetical protein
MFASIVLLIKICSLHVVVELIGLELQDGIFEYHLISVTSHIVIN